MRQRRTSHAHRAGEVNLENFLPGFVRQPMNLSATVHARVIDHYIDAPVMLDNLIDRRVDGFAVGDITLKSLSQLAKCLGTAQH